MRKPYNFVHVRVFGGVYHAYRNAPSQHFSALALGISLLIKPISSSLRYKLGEIEANNEGYVMEGRIPLSPEFTTLLDRPVPCATPLGTPPSDMPTSGSRRC